MSRRGRSGRKKWIVGTSGSDTINGSAGNDVIWGRRGDDILDGGSGNDILFGGSGNDTVRGGRGNDAVFGGSGNDLGIYELSENTGSHDYYDGGRGTDTLRLVLTAGEWADAAIRAEIEAFQAHLAGSHSRSAFTFKTFGLTARNWEALDLVIEGAPNTPPVVQSVAASAAEDGPVVTGSFDGDDADPDDDGSTLSYSITSAPSEGSVTNNNDGTFSFNPGSDFQHLAEGEAMDVSFDYEAVDSHGAVSNTGTVIVTVTGTNDAPVAVIDGGSGTEAEVVTLDVLGNDTDVDSPVSAFSLDSVSIESVTGLGGAIGGAVSIVDNKLVFNPGTDFLHLSAGETASVTVAYTMSDDHGATS
ncbi:MAG: hypothetical protein GY732_07160, partial [Gammaproteobacteria bacterium]|nr:hypothetical protein [Gammaproteobacteria bacterium]